MASWPEIKAGIFAGESGGDYDALFKYSNRAGGPFAGHNVTGMTVDEAIAFADPSGPYAQWVKANNGGTLATPMGGFQVVGSTLKQAKQWAGLTGNERMTPDIQDKIGQAILANQGTAAWAGYKGPQQPAAEAPFSSADGPKGSEHWPQPYAPADGPKGQEGWAPPPASPFATQTTAGSPYALPAAGKKDNALAAMAKAGMSSQAQPWQLPQIEPTPGAARVDQPAVPVLDPQQTEARKQQLAMILARLNQGSLA